MMRSIRRIGVLTAVGLLTPLATSAQTIGTFRWQTQPFCNVLTLAVNVAGAAFRLEGTDDQCGAATKASAVGLAFANADGSIGLGITIIAGPGGLALHVDATLLPSSGYSGTWRDNAGRSGTFFLTPGSGTGGPSRPLVSPGTYGTVLTQAAGAADRGWSAAVTTDTGTPNDAAALYGRFGAPTTLASGAPAGVRGDSDANVGVYGLSTSGFGVAGGAQTGVGVQGYGAASGSIGVQAVSLGGGTALNVHNGALTVSGDIPTAFVERGPGTPSLCRPLNHPLLNGDSNALVFVGGRNSGVPLFSSFDTATDRWQVCSLTVPMTSATRISVLIIKQQ